MTDVPLLEATDLVKTYRARGGSLFRSAPRTVALDGVSVTVHRGQSLAVVGESGSGKSTLLRVLLGLEAPDRGTVRYDGRSVDPGRRMLWLRARTGIVFQDPYSSLSPRMTVEEIVAEPLEALGIAGPHRDRVREMLARLELPDALTRYPAEFSGGQRQRIAIARALVHGPEMLIGDEPVSALDVLVRRRLVDLLCELRTALGLTLVTVTHDLGLVPELAERVLVLRGGQVVEEGRVSDIFLRPREPYTRSLIDALPRL